MKVTISQDNFSEGENSRDDPGFISNNQWQELVNCYPGLAARPREGCYLFNDNAWTSTGTIKKLIPWQDDVYGHKVIAVIDKSFYWMGQGSSTPILIGNINVLPSDSVIISHVRIGNSLYIITDYENDIYNFIIEWNISGFTIRKTNISRPVFSITATANGVGDLTTAKYYGYAFTLVNRGGNSIETAYLPGILESNADINDNQILELTGGFTAVDLTISYIGIIDPQVTHLRIYRTDPQDSYVGAQGSVFGFLVDIPISSSISYTDTEAAVSTNTITEQIGVSPMPSGTSILYHQGRIWIGGLNTTSNRGKWYYSSTGVNQKLWSNFALSSQFIDTSIDDSEKNTGIGLSQNDLIFVMQKTVWMLRDGDPATYQVQLISSTGGSRFPNTFTSIDNQLYYLSNNGPATVYSSSVQLLDRFSAKECWPTAYQNQIGLFHRLGVEGLAEVDNDPKDVIGFYFKNCYFLGWKDTVISFYMSPENTSGGAWRIEFGNSLLRLGHVAVVDNEIAVFSAKSDIDLGISTQVLDGDTGNYVSETVDKRCWRFLWKGIYLDNLTPYQIRYRGKRYSAGGNKRNAFGEAYDMVTYSEFTDSGSLYVNVITDSTRYTNKFKYVQRSKTDPNQNQFISANGIITPWRGYQQQGFPEAIIGQTFEVRGTKNFLPPFDFYLTGYDLTYILRKSYQPEFVSVSVSEIDSSLELEEELHGYINGSQN